MLDKNNLLPAIRTRSHTELELGCGPKKRSRSAIAIDVLDYPDVDIVGDIYQVLASFPDRSVDAVSAYHFIEHVPDLPALMSELARVIKPGGRVLFTAPHFSNPYFYSDPTHRAFFGLYTFCYMATGSPFRRQVPMYGLQPQFAIERIGLGFASPPEFSVLRRGFKRLQGLVFDSGIYMRELYEEHFCQLFPCHEVRYELRRQ